MGISGDSHVNAVGGEDGFIKVLGEIAPAVRSIEWGYPPS